MDALLSGMAGAAMAAVNVDDDTRIVEYTGAHATLYSTPIVLAVLTSPPYHADLEHAEGYTVLGDSTTTGFDASHAVGAEVAVTVGFKASTPLWASGGELQGKCTLSVAADFLWGSGHSITYTSAIENPAGQDVVIFTAIPYDAYAYRVVASPVPEEVGELFTLNVPRPARIYHLERSIYNRDNGDAPDIDGRLLQHTIGDPGSYPNTAERNALVAASPFLMMSPRTLTCSGGGVVSSLGCEWSEEHSAGLGVDVAVSAEMEGVAGGLLLGAGVTVHFGVELTWHWGSSTFIEGGVGDILPADWEPARAFDWGVVAYQDFLPGQGLPFTVVTYWVE